VANVVCVGGKGSRERSETNREHEANPEEREHGQGHTLCVVELKKSKVGGQLPESRRCLEGRLEEIYENKTTFERQALPRKLHNYKISSPSNLAAALAELQTMTSQLGVLGEPISDDALASIFLNALPKSFESWLDSYALLPTETRTLSYSIANVSAKARGLAAEAEESVAFFTGRQKWKNSRAGKRSDGEIRGKKRETRACYFCKKVGHLQKDCWKLKGKTSGEKITKPEEKPAVENRSSGVLYGCPGEDSQSQVVCR